MTRTDIERIVRKMLDEQDEHEQGGGAGANRAALKAIQRVSRLLTEEVIPRLSGEGREDEDEHEMMSSSARRSADEDDGDQHDPESEIEEGDVDEVSAADLPV